MRKYNSLIISVLWFLIELVIFCSLWLLYSREPFIQNLIYAIALFIGGEIIIYCTKKIIHKIKKSNN